MKPAFFLALSLLWLPAIGQPRDVLDYAALASGSYPRSVDLSAYAPGPEAIAASHQLQGRLILSGQPWDNEPMFLPTPNSAVAERPQVSCSRCPAVCCQLKVLLVAGDDPPEHFIDLDEDGQEIMGKGDDGWCAALDREAMRCSIYSRRPLVCREFAMGGADCIEERENWRRIAISLR